MLDLALADDPERHQLVLTADEQTDLRDAVAELRAFVLALMIELPKTGGLSLLAAIAVLGEAGGLTGMESRVAVLLAEGMNVREVAAATGRGESTIRSHVKQMFAKHGLSRQAELVRLVLSLAGAPESRR